MNFYGRSNRILVEQALEKGAMEDCQIAECDLSELRLKDVRWDHCDIRNSHANDMAFLNARLEQSTFFRSSMMRSSFDKVVLNSMVLDGLTLIKSQWRNAWVTNTAMKNLCLQRSGFFGCRFNASSLLDFEALDIQMDNCVFAHSMFSISYGSGMNGFSGASISNCIFYHCRFEGYPLRGAKIESCVFVYCSGEFGDEMDCSNVAGIGLRGKARYKSLQRMSEGRRLLEQYTPGGAVCQA
jgi:uncharacterized protein YjbI with pentapeptide repeats